MKNKGLKLFLGAVMVFGAISLTGCKKHEHSYQEAITKEATCTEKGTKTFTCECGDSYTEDIAAKGHTFATEWSKDETQHWHAATCGHDVKDAVAAHTWNDGEITTPATHTTKGVKTYTCTVCGQTRTEEIPANEDAHTFATEWAHNETHHWHAATCGHDVVDGKAEHIWGEGEITTPATHTTKGVKTFTCLCGATKTEEIDADVNAHTFATEWSKDETNHWYAATCGHDVKDSLAAHTWNNGEITTPATHTTKGVKTYTCTVCGQTRTEEIPANEDAHTFATEWSKDETHHWHAATCGHDVVDGKAEHIWGEGEITKAPTCTEKGTRTFTCLCGATKTEEIDIVPTAHEYGQEIAKIPATTESTGVLAHYECAHCHKLFIEAGSGYGEVTLEDITTEKLCAHSFTKQDKTKDYLVSEATCENDAYYFYACDKCGLSAQYQENANELIYADEGTALGHIFVEGYTLVEDPTDLEVGDRIIIAAQTPDGRWVAVTTTTSGNYRTGKVVTVTDGKITDANGLEIFTLGDWQKKNSLTMAVEYDPQTEKFVEESVSVQGLFSLKMDSNGKFIYAYTDNKFNVSSSTSIPSSSNNGYSWSFYLENGVMKAKAVSTNSGRNIAFYYTPAGENAEVMNFAFTTEKSFLTGQVYDIAIFKYNAVVAVEPTCTESGNIACGICERCGKYVDKTTLKEIESIVSEATGHTPVATFDWAADKTTCNITIVCETCEAKLVEEQACTITHTPITEEDKIVHEAKYTFDGHEYTDSKEESTKVLSSLALKDGAPEVVYFVKPASGDITLSDLLFNEFTFVATYTDTSTVELTCADIVFTTESTLAEYENATFTATYKTVSCQFTVKLANNEYWKKATASKEIAVGKQIIIVAQNEGVVDYALGSSLEDKTQPADGKGVQKISYDIFGNPIVTDGVCVVTIVEGTKPSGAGASEYASYSYYGLKCEDGKVILSTNSTTNSIGTQNTATAYTSWRFFVSSGYMRIRCDGRKSDGTSENNCTIAAKINDSEKVIFYRTGSAGNACNMYVYILSQHIVVE